MGPLPGGLSTPGIVSVAVDVQLCPVLMRVAMLLIITLAILGQLLALVPPYTLSSGRKQHEISRHPVLAALGGDRASNR
jgi:hypothetical protein